MSIFLAAFRWYLAVTSQNFAWKKTPDFFLSTPRGVYLNLALAFACEEVSIIDATEDPHDLETSERVGEDIVCADKERSMVSGAHADTYDLPPSHSRAAPPQILAEKCAAPPGS